MKTEEGRYVLREEAAIRAFQWHGKALIPGATFKPWVYHEVGGSYYITGPRCHPRFFLSASIQGPVPEEKKTAKGFDSWIEYDGGKYHRRLIPFAYFSVNGPRNDRHLQAFDFERVITEPEGALEESIRDYFHACAERDLEPRCFVGGQLVVSGWWVHELPGGGREILNDETFRTRYKPLDPQEAEA